MPYYFFSGKITLNTTILIDGLEAQHILQSQRMRQNSIIEIQDQTNQRYQCIVTDIQRHQLYVKAQQQIIPPPESPLKLNLYLALIKEKALDFILQKATELGVTSIHLIQTQYSQPVPTTKVFTQRLQRWERIAAEACKQSKRHLIPPITFDGDLTKISHCLTHCLHFDQKNAVPFDYQIKIQNPVNFLIGPEGGFSHNEIQHLTCPKLSLGPRILRTETAVIATISILQHCYGDLK